MKNHGEFKSVRTTTNHLESTDQGQQPDAGGGHQDGPAKSETASGVTTSLAGDAGTLSGPVTALQELLAKVEAGTVTHVGKKAKWPDFDFEGKGYGYHVNANMALAYHGSLDAAKALHEAVIDDYNFLVGVDWVGVWLPFGSTLHNLNVSNTIPARAWLIAIIKALIAQEKAT
jgi:hypothetical protein